MLTAYQRSLHTPKRQELDSLCHRRNETAKPLKYLESRQLGSPARHTVSATRTRGGRQARGGTTQHALAMA